MDLNSNNNNDQCQHPEGCSRSLFTYCPHCHLFLCIVHLNQHHDSMKNDIHQTINEAETYRSLLEQQIIKIKQQQITLNDLYEYELKNLNHIQEFLTNLCENNSLLMSEYEQYIKQFECIKQSQVNNSFTKVFILQIDQILQQQQQQNQIIESKDEISITTNILSVSDNETTIDNNKILAYSESCTKEEEELVIESTMDCHENELSNQTDPESSSLQSKLLINFIYQRCPLSDINAFGFSLHHNIPDVPCKYPKKSIELTFDQCYYHLISSHRLKPKVARLILKTLSTHENTDLTTLNIFSHWTSTEILSQGTTLFIGQCPLTQKNIYGLQNQHNLILCTPRPSLHLYHHLRTFHHFKSNYARRLINALIEKVPLTEEVFQPNDKIINNSNRRKT